MSNAIAFSQSFSGKVINSLSKEAVPHASVYIVDLEIGSQTDENGLFIIQGNFTDSMRVRIRALGYEDLYTFNFTEQIIFELSETHLKLQEVSVSSPISEIQKDNVVYIDSRKLSELNSIPGSLGENLENIPGVYQSSSGPGISKPVIRGMQGSRVVTILNGLRIENQQWGGDHGNVFTSLGIGSVEIIKGPASLMFGADAIGGTAYFVDRPYIAQNFQKIHLETRYESVTNGLISSGEYQISKKKWRFNASGLYSNQADYKLPSGQYALNSRFNEKGGKLSFGFNKKKWVINMRYAFSQNRIGLPGHTHDSIVNPLSFQVENQSRNKIIPIQLNNSHFISVENKWLQENGNVLLMLGHSFNQLQEFEEKVTIAALNTSLNSSQYHLKWTFNARLNNSSLKIVSGIQGGLKINQNGTSWEDNLLPDYQQLDNGIYSLLSLKNSRWVSMIGLRYDHRNLDVYNSDLAGDFSKIYSSLNGSAGVVYSDSINIVRLNASTGFRGPHVSELSAYGTHHGALRYEIGNLNLMSERGTQFDFTYELSREHIELIINPFYNYIQNYITITPTDSIADGLSVFKYDQLPNAQLYGGDIGIHYHPHFAHWMHLESSFSYLNSDNGNGGYLPLIPQNRLSSSVRLDLNPFNNKRFKIKNFNIQHRFFNHQRNVSELESTSRSYNIINVGVNMIWETKNPLEIGVGVKNLMGENYIDHLSRLKNISLQHPGRSIYIKLAWDIKIKAKNK